MELEETTFEDGMRQSETPQSDSPQNGAAQKKKSKTPFIVLGIALLMVLGGGIGYYIFLQSIPSPLPVVELRPQLIPIIDETEPEPERVENPIDFEALSQINPDVHAWISVPGTTVDYPICQEPNDNAFYLNHDFEKSFSNPGTLYTEVVNSKSLTDSVTLIYGHVGYPEIMFSTLHYFNDKEFFDSHEYFTIYTPGHILTYRVISAYVYDDRHIMNTFDFAREEVLAEYYNFITKPDSMSYNIRDGVTLTADDRIVQLSTCMENLLLVNNRYIVTGQLVEDQLTY